MLTATACAHDTTGIAPRAISEYCLIAKAITFSEAHPGDVEDASNKYDTADTVQQVKNNDLAYDRVCPNGAPPQ
jgi:hypothetical protein